MLKKLTVFVLSLALSACAIEEIKLSNAEETVEEVSDTNHFLQAKQAYADKDYGIARYHYEIIVKQHPNYEQALFRLGNIAMRNNKLDKAQDYYNRVVKIKPAHAQTHHNLAILYLKQANKHLNYYIANDDSANNKAVSRLMNAVDRYADSRRPQKTELDTLAELVNAE